MNGWFNLLGWFLSIITATGNGFVVYLIAKNRRLHSPVNWLVVSLAVADFGVGAAVFPSGYLCSKITCNMRVFVAFYWFFLHSSVTNLCDLSWDRYTAITHPFRYITCMTARHPRLIISLAWLIPLVISLSLVLGMYATNSHTAWKILRLTGGSAFDILACLLLFYGFIRVLFVARGKAKDDLSIHRSVRSIEQSSSQSKFAKRRKRPNTALFLTAIVTFFLGCHTVINFLVLYITFCSDVPDIVPGILTLLLVLNSAVNPLVYAVLKQDIKRELNQLIFGGKRRNVTD